MPSSFIEQMRNSPGFVALSRKRRESRIAMVGLMMLVFLTYLTCWAFIPGVINARVPEDSPVSIGIWFTVAVVVLSIILSGYYTLVIGKKMDRLNQQLLKEVDHD
ncbi:DUF485 domain-containing protein [Pseudomaricurvus alkylphenolicus]|uniref:DUF485 domain-containing protein n=1 Tax=Pseudomaricurvus alkylphenolicus TaxID=1306991 RepID=UPI0014208D75|nr:DUF485 domain-containing protein [Pseudomaricurvus alkylphenolicus]NIB40673.1 DUF485 domain-containing protein [Pseudomaricurvus alkylphenolicus]